MGSLKDSVLGSLSHRHNAVAKVSEIAVRVPGPRVVVIYLGSQDRSPKLGGLIVRHDGPERSVVLHQEKSSHRPNSDVWKRQILHRVTASYNVEVSPGAKCIQSSVLRLSIFDSNPPREIPAYGLCDSRLALTSVASNA